MPREPARSAQQPAVVAARADELHADRQAIGFEQRQVHRTARRETSTGRS